MSLPSLIVILSCASPLKFSLGVKTQFPSSFSLTVPLPSAEEIEVIDRVSPSTSDAFARRVALSIIILSSSVVAKLASENTGISLTAAISILPCAVVVAVPSLTAKENGTSPL